MKNQVKILMFVGLLALMLPLLFGYALGPVGANNHLIVKTHQDSKDVTNLTCQVAACHPTNSFAAPTSMNPPYNEPHRTHLMAYALRFDGNAAYVPENTEGCGDCHEETVYGAGVGAALGSGYEGDLSYTQAEADSVAGQWSRSANKAVKAGVCETCHGEFNLAVVPATAHTGPFQNCKASDCHDGTGNGSDPAVAHSAVEYIDAVSANVQVGSCWKCHGGNAWYQTTEVSGDPLPQ